MLSRGPHDAVKRAIDLVLSIIGIVLTSPIQLLIAILVRLNLGKPVLFRQVRPGEHERLFELVKFRTMLHPDPEKGLVTDGQRMTPFGRWLRATSLDELPTLWNVLKGDMSVVGPRPLLVQYLDRYTPEQRLRHTVRPGLTGLAQVSGRNAISWDQKFQLDVAYVKTRSLKLDFWILGRTIVTILKRSGIAADGAPTMPEYLGPDGGQA